MVRYEFPTGGHDPRSVSKRDSTGENQEDSTTRRDPEIIYIDEVSIEPELEESTDHGQLYNSINQLEKVHYPFFLRLITFFASLALLILLPLFALFVAAHGLIAGLLVFKNPTSNAKAWYYWKQLKKTAAVMLSLLIATISPSFGFGMIILYFVLQGEEIHNSFLNQIMNRKN